MELTISGKDIRSLKKVEALAKQLGLHIARRLPNIVEQPGRKETLMDLMREMSASGGIKSIKDPIEWQREIRKDRDLPGRNQ